MAAKDVNQKHQKKQLKENYLREPRVDANLMVATSSYINHL